MSRVGWILDQGHKLGHIHFFFIIMLKAGIVDPAKVTRSAVQNAASVGTMVLTTECLIADIPEKNDPAAGGGMPGGMGGGMGGMY